MSMSPISSALGGLTAATRQLEGSANRIAQFGTDLDLGKEVAEQVQAKTAFKANLATLRTADEMMGMLLDLKV
jgi:hypothetical protein